MSQPRTNKGLRSIHFAKTVLDELGPEWVLLSEVMQALFPWASLHLRAYRWSDKQWWRLVKDDLTGLERGHLMVLNVWRPLSTAEATTFEKTEEHLFQWLDAVAQNFLSAGLLLSEQQVGSAPFAVDYGSPGLLFAQEGRGVLSPCYRDQHLMLEWLSHASAQDLFEAAVGDYLVLPSASNADPAHAPSPRTPDLRRATDRVAGYYLNIRPQTHKSFLEHAGFFVVPPPSIDERILTYVRAHPGASTKAIAVGLGGRVEADSVVFSDGTPREPLGTFKNRCSKMRIKARGPEYT